MQGGRVRCPIFYAQTGRWKDAVPARAEKEERKDGALPLEFRESSQGMFFGKRLGQPPACSEH